MTTDMKHSVRRFVKLMKSKKGIAIVGKAYTGKTTILRAVSAVMAKVFNKQMKHATISPATFSLDEFYGKASNSNELKLHDSIFSMILKGYKEE